MSTTTPTPLTSHPRPGTLDSLKPTIGKLDLGITVVPSLLALLLGHENYTGGPTNAASSGGPYDPSVLVIPGMLLITLPLLWRSSRPLVGLGLLSLGAVLVWALFG